MSLTYGEATRFDDLLPAIVRQVVSATKLPAEKVLLTLADDDYHAANPPGDQFVLVRPTMFPVASGVPGGGRATTGFDGRVEIVLLTRYTSDKELSNVKLLTEKTLGIMANGQRLIEGVQLFEPRNTDGVVMLREPMRLTDLSYDSIKAKAGSPWVLVKTKWQTIFNTVLTVPDYQTT